MARKWVKFPHPDKAYVHDAAGLKKHWARLHKGDCEPLPKDADVLAAWAAFHAGDYARAVELGTGAGDVATTALMPALLRPGGRTSRVTAPRGRRGARRPAP